VGDYRPDPLPPDLAASFAESRHRLGALGQPLLYFSAIGSTNDVAASIAEGGPSDGAVVIADAQTAGRGRRGRPWFSPPGSGLYVSIVLDIPGRSPDPARATALLTLAAGAALSEAVEAATGIRADIKWPNDLLIDGRKIGGILAEGVTNATQLTSVVLGYGINLAPSSFPPELRGRASSLETELGRPVDRAALCVETLIAVARRRDDLVAGRFDAILSAWRERAPRSRGALVTWRSESGPRSGVTMGIDEQGALLIRVGSGVERILAGEVEWECS
jgi:BirA family transcriptional regulator, biotin operon repressor / biotin---[acetyl-CoA-carboxylase] ligase